MWTPQMHRPSSRYLLWTPQMSHVTCVIEKSSHKSNSLEPGFNFCKYCKHIVKRFWEHMLRRHKNEGKIIKIHVTKSRKPYQRTIMYRKLTGKGPRKFIDAS
uniref:Uncharacterized protein n=1 Tax=Cacopsylla melanoneura TaxID=428564 RepID=A0A8D8ZJE0_9HEMI